MLYICLVNTTVIKQSKMRNLTNHDKLFLAAQNLIQGHIVGIHDEAKGYAFKRYETGKWERVSFDFLNHLAGLGYINICLL